LTLDELPVQNSFGPIPPARLHAIVDADHKAQFTDEMDADSKFKDPHISDPVLSMQNWEIVQKI